MPINRLLNLDLEEDNLNPNIPITAPLTFTEEMKLLARESLGYTPSVSIYNMLQYRGYGTDQQVELRNVAKSIDEGQIKTQTISEVLKKQSELGRELTDAEKDDIKNNVRDEYTKTVDNRVVTIPKVKLNEKQWKESDYYRPGLKFNKMSDSNGFVTEDLARLLSERHDKELYIQERLSAQKTGFLSNHSLLRSAAGLATGFVVQAMDPLNAALSFIPIVGEVTEARMMGILGNNAGRLFVGGIKGGGGNLLIEPFVYGSKKLSQQEYTYKQSMFNLGAGVILGSGLHFLPGLYTDKVRSNMVRRAKLEAANRLAAAEAIKDLSQNNPIDVEPILKSVKIDDELSNKVRISPYEETVPKLEPEKIVEELPNITAAQSVKQILKNEGTDWKAFKEKLHLQSNDLEHLIPDDIKKIDTYIKTGEIYKPVDMVKAKKDFESNTSKYSLVDREGKVIRDLETRKQIMRDKTERHIFNKISTKQNEVENLQIEVDNLKSLNQPSETIDEIVADVNRDDYQFNAQIKDAAQALEDRGGIYVRSLKNSGFTDEEIRALNNIKPNIINHGGRGLTVNSVNRYHDKTMFGNTKNLVKEMLESPKKRIPNPYEHKPISASAEKDLEKAKRALIKKEAKVRTEAEKELKKDLAKESTYIEPPRDGYGVVKDNEGNEIINDVERDKQIDENLKREWKEENTPNPDDLIDDEHKIIELHRNQEEMGLSDEEMYNNIHLLMKRLHDEMMPGDEVLAAELDMKYQDYFLTNEARAEKKQRLLDETEKIAKEAAYPPMKENEVVKEVEKPKVYDNVEEIKNLETINKDIEDAEYNLFHDPNVTQEDMDAMKTAQRQITKNIEDYKVIKDELIDCAVMLIKGE